MKGNLYRNLLELSQGTGAVLKRVASKQKPGTYANYAVIATTLCALQFNLAACSIKLHLNFSGKHPATLQLMRGYIKYLPVFIPRYSFTQLNELEQF